MNNALPPSPDPPPLATIYLRPGDGRTFYANQRMYELSAAMEVLEDGVPRDDGVLAILLALYLAQEVYRQDQNGEWSHWGEGFVPSLAPPDWLPPPPPPSLLAVEEAAAAGVAPGRPSGPTLR